MSINIYVACLASYNNGILYGKWFELWEYTDEDSLLEDIEAMLAKSSIEDSEEWEIHDFDSEMDSTRLKKYNLKDLIELDKAIASCDDEVELVEDMLANGVDIDELADKYNNLYFYRDFEEYAREYIDGAYNTKENEFLIRYLDWEKLGKDLRMDITYYETKQGIYIDFD